MGLIWWLKGWDILNTEIWCTSQHCALSHPVVQNQGVWCTRPQTDRHTHRHTLGPMCSRLTCWISFVKLPRRIWISDCHWICIIRKSWRWNTNAPTNSQLHRRSLSPGLAVNQAWIIIRYTGTTGRNNTVAACYIFHPQSGGECCGTRLQTHWKALSYTTGLAASGG